MEQLLERSGTEIFRIVTVYGLDVVAALAILVVGWTVAGWLGRTTRRGLERLPQVDATLRPVAASLVRYTVLIATVLAALSQIGVETTSIIAVLGAAGLAIALALQGTLGNVAAGVTLLVLRPFRVGDYIEAGGTAGTVDAIGLFVTELHTGDNVYISVPNSALWNAAIKNYSRNPTRRIEIVVGVGYEDDLDKAIAAIESEVTADPRVLAEPAPVTAVQGLADSSVNVVVRAWTRTPDAWTTTRDLTKRIKERLDREGITIPYPQRTVHLTGGS